MKACPICRARSHSHIELNATTATCSRCGSDLTLLFTLERQARASLAKAVYAICRGDRKSALAATRISRTVAEDSLSKFLWFFLQANDNNLP